MSSSSFRPDIEGLRAIAILLVVGYHVGVPGLSGGYIGVDVFFVLSGYLITGLLRDELRRTGKIDLVEFYARRTRRLLPALAVVLLATTLIGMVVYAPIEQEGLANTALSTALYASNVYFTRASTDYLAARAAANPLLHTWSLSVEEQFYLVWPLFLMLAVGAFLHRRRRETRAMVPWMIAVAVGSLTLCVYLTTRQQPWAFFLSPPRAWEFALGGLAVLPARPFETASSGIVGAIGLAGMVYSAATFNSATPFPGFAAALPTVATALALRAGAVAPHRGTARLLGIPPLQYFGRLSYSWYLWHWPVLVLAEAIKGPMSAYEKAAFAALSLAIAHASFRLIERPIRFNRRLVSRPRMSLAAAAALTVFGVALSLTWAGASAHWTTSPTQARYRPLKLDLPVIYRMGCDDYFHSSEARECVFGAADAPRTAVLFGDSHAGQWFPAVDRVFNTPGWRLVVLTKSACPAVDALFFFADIGRVYSECHDWLRASLTRIRDIHPAVVIVAYSKEYPFNDDAWRTGISAVFDALSRSSEHVLVLRDTPRLSFDALSCLARLDWRPAFLKGGATCLTVLRPGEPDALYALQSRIARNYANVHTLDMTGYICPQDRCDVVQGGIVTYRDSHHITRLFAEALADDLKQELAPTLRDMPSHGSKNRPPG